MAISLSSGLLAASMLIGQVQDVPAPSQPRPSIFGGIGQPMQGSSRGIFGGWFSREDRPVMNKLQSWFGRKDQQEPPLARKPTQPMIQSGPTIIEGTPTSGPTIVPSSPTPIEFPRKLPNPQSSAPRPLPVATPVSSARPVEPTSLSGPAGNAKSPLLPQLLNKVGRDEKFEWITGQLEIEAGGYVLYYATPETVDTYHGRMPLHPQQLDMSTFRRGDLVSVRGDLTQRTSAQGRSPVYRATDIQLIERVR